MLGWSFRYPYSQTRRIVALVTLLSFLFAPVLPALALDATRGGVLPQPLPLFPGRQLVESRYQQLAGGSELFELHQFYQ